MNTVSHVLNRRDIVMSVGVSQGVLLAHEWNSQKHRGVVGECQEMPNM